MNTYEGKIFTKFYEKSDLGDTTKANSEFSKIEKICKEVGANPNISAEINKFKTNKEDNIMSIQCRYFLAGIEKDNEKGMLPYAAHIAVMIDVTAGMTRINVKYNPELKPVSLLNKLVEVYGPSIRTDKY